MGRADRAAILTDVSKPDRRSQTRRLARLDVTLHLLQEFIHGDTTSPNWTSTPADLCVVGVFHDPQRVTNEMVLTLIVESDTFEPVPEGGQIPTIYSPWFSTVSANGPPPEPKPSVGEWRRTKSGRREMQ